jgi:hypothetical protein
MGPNTIPNWLGGRVLFREDFASASYQCFSEVCFSRRRRAEDGPSSFLTHIPAISSTNLFLCSEKRSVREGQMLRRSTREQ